jgi:hypothetical protein
MLAYSFLYPHHDKFIIYLITKLVKVSQKSCFTCEIQIELFPIKISQTGIFAEVFIEDNHPFHLSRDKIIEGLSKLVIGDQLLSWLVIQR